LWRKRFFLYQTLLDQEALAGCTAFTLIHRYRWCCRWDAGCHRYH
jgi:hypothetical protein